MPSEAKADGGGAQTKQATRSLDPLLRKADGGKLHLAGAEAEAGASLAGAGAGAGALQARSRSRSASAPKTLNPAASASDEIPMLVCINCARPVVFEDAGWRHRDPTVECARVAIAWPPPAEEDNEEEPVAPGDEHAA